MILLNLPQFATHKQSAWTLRCVFSKRTLCLVRRATWHSLSRPTFLPQNGGHTTRVTSSPQSHEKSCHPHPCPLHGRQRSLALSVLAQHPWYSLNTPASPVDRPADRHARSWCWSLSGFLFLLASQPYGARVTSPPNQPLHYVAPRPSRVFYARLDFGTLAFSRLAHTAR